MNSVAVASPTPSLQPTSTNAANAYGANANANAHRSSPSAAVHAAMQRSAFARQTTTNANFSNTTNFSSSANGANNQFVSRAAQMQMQQASYYAAPTRSRRAGSRDRAWTDTTTQKPSQPTTSEMAAVLRPRATRATMAPAKAASPQTQTQASSTQYQLQLQQHTHHYKQQQQFPTLVHHQPQRHAAMSARSTPQQPQPQQPYQHPLQHTQQRASPSMQHQHQMYQQQQQQQRMRTPPTSRTPPASMHASQPVPKTPPPPPPSAVEWRVAVDPKSKRPYYYHPVTRQTSWKKPQELVDKEKNERASFFAAMESNIRAKLRDGNWFRDSLTSRPGDLDDMALAEEDTDDGELSSSTSTSSRSSWSSTTTASVASAPSTAVKSRTQPSQPQQQHTRSLPTSPELEPKASVGGSNNQDDHEALLLAAAKPPTLFRTLSSYETPVVGETKKLANGRVIAVPSPILERVRLAGMDDMPRSSDLEAYTRPDINSLLNSAGPDSTSASKETSETMSRGIVRAPLRRRSNSTSTIYVRMGTMNKPDQDTTIQCIATVLRAHLMEAQSAPFPVDGKFEIFVNQRDQRADAIPSLKDIGVFIKHVFSRAQMESECIIMSLIYVERLLKATMGSLQLLPGNWRSILFCSMVMASKVWDDLSMCNADFSKIWPELSLKEINELELAYLSAVEYNVRVSAVSYAKYYFHLRSMCATMGMLESFDESAPLNLDGARKMQVLSEEYQERTKLLPAPSRRRSVTITTPSSAGADPRTAALNGGSLGPQNKWSPTASLEQLVQMQSRVAGGTSLATMHRLSTTSASSKA